MSCPRTQHRDNVPILRGEKNDISPKILPPSGIRNRTADSDIDKALRSNHRATSGKQVNIRQGLTFHEIELTLFLMLINQRIKSIKSNNLAIYMSSSEAECEKVAAAPKSSMLESLPTVFRFQPLEICRRYIRVAHF